MNFDNALDKQFEYFDPKQNATKFNIWFSIQFQSFTSHFMALIVEKKSQYNLSRCSAKYKNINPISISAFRHHETLDRGHRSFLVSGVCCWSSQIQVSKLIINNQQRSINQYNFDNKHYFTYHPSSNQW